MSQLESKLSNDSSTSPEKKASFFQIVRAVLWSMLGVRQQKGYEDDTAKITLKQAVIAGLLGGVMFVATIATLVILAIKYMGK
jgi:Protein of unknown function (DUF2970)